MVDMLVDEEARQEDNTTGVCMEYLLKNGILQYLVNVSEKMDYPEGIRGEAIRTIASMVDLLDDRFLVHNAVHKPTIKLLRFCVLDERQSELDHEDLVDLMYIICSKIHGFPALLNIFFHDKQWLTTPQKTNNNSFTSLSTSLSAATATSAAATATNINSPPEYEFLLFTYLLRFVHREGRSGDFARTGLLFLMEMAVDQLGEFILESDFATIMAAGLGALYSQLPRKLIIKDDAEINSSPASYLLGQDLDPRAFPSEEFGVEQSNSEQFKYQLDSFLKLLEFCQDILLRCPNDAISERLLQCIRMIFLENILYPSILECSDIDGSSVAVVSYIDLILQTVQQQDLADVIVGFLMNASDDEEELLLVSKMMSSPISPTSNSSNNMFAGVEFDRFKSSPYFTTAERFTLKDLIFSRLKSSSQPTVIATLKLLRTLIIKHCRFANRLLSTTPDLPKKGNEEPSTIISHHIREIELYFALVSAIDGVHADDILTLGYEDYLRDIEATIDHDFCFKHNTGPITTTTTTSYHQQKATATSKSEKRRSFKYGQQQQKGFQQQQAPGRNTTRCLTQRQRHRIRPTDTLIQILLGLLSHFFAQSSELNLALTGVISALAICPHRSLEGWIAFSESDRTNAEDVLNLSTQQPNVSTNNNNAATEDQGGIRGSEIYASSTQIQEQQEEDDDQSVDFGADRNSIHMTTPTQFKSFPPFYTLFRTLTQQIDYYRSEVDEFDRLLDERWNGLLFGEPTTTCALLPGTPIPTTTTSSSAATKTSNRRGSIFDQQQQQVPTMSAPTTMTSKLFGSPILSKKRSSMNLLKASTSSSTVTTHTTTAATTPPNPSKSLSSTTTAAAMAVANGTMVTSSSTTTNGATMAAAAAAAVATTPTTPSHAATTTSAGTATAATATNANANAMMVPAIHPLSPLAMHAKKTLQVRIQPLFPSNFEIDRDDAPILNLDQDDEDTFAPTRPNPSQRKKMDKTTEISLSMLLNNVVILEETIKELVAIMQVRRSLGIDKIRYT